MPNPTPASPNPPPPIKSNRGRVLFLAIAGAIVAAVLLFVIFNIDRPATSTADDPPDQHVIDLIPPAPLAEDETGGAIGDLRRNIQSLGAENTWIQTSKDGRLAQQYRFASHDPSPEGLPPGWSKVLKPEIQVFLAEDRVVTLRSDSALLRAPSQRVESGKMNGQVLIRYYELEGSQRFDPDKLTPSIEARTDEAYFDNMQGEVRCDGWVDVQTPTAHLPGFGLRILINEVEDRIERLRLDKPGQIRLAAVQESVSGPPNQDADETPSDSTISAEPAPANEATLQGDDGAGSRPRSPPARRSSSRPIAPPPQAGPLFYKLTLKDDVRVRQRGETDGWTAEGDELHLIFSLENRSLSGLRAAKSSQLHSQNLLFACSPWSMTTFLAAITIAAAPADKAPGLFQASDDDIVIECSGVLTMAPFLNVAERPASADDARLLLIGRPVKWRSFPDAADVRCHQFVYHSLEQRMVLKSSPEFAGSIESPELRGEFDEFWFSRLTNEGGFSRAGWMVMRERNAALTAPEGGEVADEPKDLRIQWQQRVDLEFDKAADAAMQPEQRQSIGKLRSANFVGDVEVHSDEIFMRADSMLAAFPPQDAAALQGHRASVDSIVAVGAVYAQSLVDEGSIGCDKLNVKFIRGADGRSVPSLITATGNVAAIDRDRQHVWSEFFEVAFQLLPENELAVPPPPGSAGRSARVKTLVATGNVQVLMTDGARAFADRLEAEALTEVVVLTGDNVMVVSDRGLVYGGRRFELHKANNVAIWPGAGQFSHFAYPIVSNELQRIQRPVLNQIDTVANPIQISANWTESMNFDGSANDGAGSLVLSGNVNGESWQTAMERNTVKGHALTMHFAHAPATETDDSGQASAAGGLNTFAGSGKRQLKQFITTGGEADATLENRTWVQADRSDTPRVYYIAGPVIEYDSLTLEARVPGRGVLLVRDDRVEMNQPQNNRAFPFSSKGATQFRWSDHLLMTQRPDAPGMYDIAMIGNVEVRHLGVDQQVSTMTGDQLHATVERTAPAPGDRAGEGAGLDLGGAMELRRLRATGNVYIKSPTRDVECEDLDYDYLAGMATLRALPGRTVAVITTGNPNPMRAESVIWNLIEDKITATNLRGAAPR